MPATARHRVGALWLGIAAGPLLWLATQQLSHSLAALGCGPRGTGMILAVNVMGALLAMAGSLRCWRDWRALPEPADGRAERRFMAGLGVMLGLIFAAVMLASAAATFFFSACER